MKKIYFSVLMLALLFILTSFYIVFFYPFHFAPVVVEIIPEMTLTDISSTLSKDHIVNSGGFFKLAMEIERKDKNIIPGEYLFSKRDNVFHIISRITSGDFEMPQKKVILPEGSTNAEMSKLIKAIYPDFNTIAFKNETTNSQGYLFPDTYFFKGSSTDQIVSALKNNFTIQTKALKAQAEKNGQNWNEVVTVASILEEEGNNKNDYSIIAGILEKRLDMGMALQVDSAPSTYKEKGLPLQPISNPGIIALEAALNPTKTDYLYYLTGKDGLMHYAKTYEEHLQNKKKYL